MSAANNRSKRKLSIVYRPVSGLRPDPKNARTHSKRQVNQIADSIAEFGFTNPVLIDPDANIIAGHGRLRAARQLGIAEVPTITLTNLSDEQIRLLRLADNKIALNAGWDVDLLKVELGELAELQVDLGVTGFAAGELDVILSSGNDPDDELIPAPVSNHLPEGPSTNFSRVASSLFQ